MNKRTLLGVVALTALMTLLIQSILPINRWTQWLMPQNLKGVLSQKNAEMLGYTQYTTYLSAGKEALSGQVQLLTATVSRDETTTQTIERVILPRLSPKLASSASIAVHYQAQYAFGYDLRPEAFDLRAGDKGIEIHVKKPTLLTAPSVSQLTHEVLSTGLLTDEDAATLKLYEQAAAQAQKNGEAMSQDPAIQALCEKQLIAFMSDFLAKQSGVKVVPQIRVVYD